MNLNRVTTKSGIVIGIRHFEPPPLHSSDATAIQTALLARRRANRLAQIVGALLITTFLRRKKL